MYSKRVKASQANYFVFSDYCESDLECYETLEDAKEALEERKEDAGYGGEFEHFLTKRLDSITVDHDEYRKSIGLDEEE